MKGKNYKNPRVLAFQEDYGLVGEDPVKIIRRLVGVVRERSGIENSSPPYYPNQFAKEMDVVVKPNQSLLTDAGLVEQGDRFVIYYAPDVAVTRQRFSVYHEMCHVFFSRASRKKKAFLSTRERQNLQKYYFEEERLCNVGAAEFLLPERVFRQYITGVEPSIATFYELARVFGASVDATLFRFGEIFEGRVIVESWVWTPERSELRTIICSDALRRVSRWRKEREQSVPPIIKEAAVAGGKVFGLEEFLVRGRFRTFRAEAVRRRKFDGGGEVLCVLVPDEGSAAMSREPVQRTLVFGCGAR